MSAADPQRAVMSRSSARITTSSSRAGTSGCTADGRAMSPSTTADSVASGSSRANSRWPTSISQSSTPTENRSVCTVSASLRTCSGDMYGNDPVGAACPGPGERSASAPLHSGSSSPLAPSVTAIPKSTSLTSPSRDSMTLRGERSRWITPSPLRCA